MTQWWRWRRRRWRWRWRWRWIPWVVHQDEFAEVELVGEPFPFGLVQDAFVVVVSGDEMLLVFFFMCHTDSLSSCCWRATEIKMRCVVVVYFLDFFRFSIDCIC